MRLLGQTNNKLGGGLAQRILGYFSHIFFSEVKGIWRTWRGENPAQT